MKKVLVTGGAGFIGSRLAGSLCGKCEVVVIDNFHSGNPENISGLDLELVEGDIRDARLVARAVKGVDSIFHLAALVSPAESLADPQKCAEINVGGTSTVLEAAVNAGVSRFLFWSSCSVYGNSTGEACRETDTPAPGTPYACSKLEGESESMKYSGNGSLRTTILRCFNVFGPRQNPSGPYAAAVPKFISRALTGQNLPVFGAGEQTRDFIYVDDVAKIAISLAENNRTGIYNVASGISTSINRLARKIILSCSSESRIEHLPARKNDILRSSADIRKITALNLSPGTPLDRGIEKTTDFFRKGF